MAVEAETEKQDLTDPQEVTPDELKTPEDEGSLASILEQNQRPVFTGHPADESEEVVQEEAAQGDEGGDVPSETKGTPDKEVPEGWEFVPKYKTHQEAERGAREHQAMATKKAEEAARDREAREALERERDELRQKLAEAEKEEAAKVKEPVEATKTSEELEVEQEGRIEAALDEIGQLDEFDPGYKKKVARAWRKAGIGGAGQPTVPTGKALDELIDRRVEERMQAREKQQTEATAREKEAAEGIRIRAQAGELAGNFGLNMKEGTADHILFWATVNEMPKDLDDKPFEDQVQWAVNKVRHLKGQVVQSKEEMDERGRQAQIDNAVLGHGGARPKKAATPEPFTLGSIISKQQATRRI